MTKDELWKQLNESVREGVVSVEYTKKDGTKRTMVCTLVPEYWKEYDFKSGNTLEQSMIIDMLVVWDIEADGWRTLLKDGVESVEESDEG